MTILRRPLLVAGFALAGLATGLMVSLAVPLRYEASAIVAVAADDPDTGASLDLRLPALERELLSTSRLQIVVADIDPCAAVDERGGSPAAASVECLRDALRLRVRTQGELEIRYSHTDPGTARDVVRRLTSLLVGGRPVVLPPGKGVPSATASADPELTVMKRRIDEMQGQIDRLGNAPSPSRSLAELRAHQNDRRALSAELKLAESHLEDLRAASEAGTIPPPTGGPSGEVEKLRSELAALRARYTDQHPDVQTLLERLRRAEARETPTARAPAPIPEPADLVAAEDEIERLRARGRRVSSAVTRAEERVSLATRSGANATALIREHRRLQEEYVARLAERSETGSDPSPGAAAPGTRFRLVAPAHWPREPSSPNWVLFAVLGFFGGLALGGVASWLSERLDGRIRDGAEVEAMLDAPRLVSIPEVHVSRRERQRHQRSRSDR